MGNRAPGLFIVLLLCIVGMSQVLAPVSARPSLGRDDLALDVASFSLSPISEWTTAGVHASPRWNIESDPSEDTPTPTEDAPTPTEDAPTPTSDMPTPTEDAPTPTSDMPTPTEDAPTPTDDMPTPTEDVQTPTTDTPTATEEIPTATQSPTASPTRTVTPRPSATATSTPTLTSTPSPTVPTRGSILGLVYQDQNANRELDEGEPGEGGVLVVLLDSAGRQLEYQTTASDGRFTFPALFPATYRVQQYDLPGAYSTTPNLVYIPLQAGESWWVSFGDRYSATPTTVATEALYASYLPLSAKKLSLPLSTPTPTATATPRPYSQAVNCGSTTGYQASDDFWYAADQAYTTGSWGWEGASARAWETKLDVQGTSEDPLYNTQRYGMTAYRFDVPGGRYQVLLCFAELVSSAKQGSRVFAVELEGVRVLDNFDLVALGARNRALQQVFNVAVSDGVLDIVFVAQSTGYSPVINAIRVRQTGA